MAKKTKTIYCPDIECGSCVRLITRTLARLEGVGDVKFKKDSLDVEFHDEKVAPEAIVSAIQSSGFRADFTPFSRKTFKERCRDFVENKEKYEVERAMLAYSAIILVLLLALEAALYLSFRSTQAITLQKYIPWMVYLDIFAVSITAALWHFKSYRADVTSMLGMMIGMTFGMQSGMMIGTVVGATNGMFTGSMTGMIIGTLLGYYTGKCCGIMGVLQGMMAGAMGGIMGGMTGVMLLPDNILWFMPLFALINILIMGGLSYLLYEDMVEENPKTKKDALGFWTFFIYAIIGVVVITLIIIYGPKSGFARVI